MKNILETVMSILVIMIIYIFLGFVFGLVMMWLWNWLMPVIFGLPAIGYWQGFGLYLLSGLFFRTGVSLKKS